MSQLIVCAECNKHLQVPAELLGQTVQCPECQYTFTAAAPEKIEAAMPAPVKPPASKRRDDEDEDYDDRPRSPRPTRTGRGPDQKPSKVTAIGVMTLIGGIFAVLWAISSGAVSGGICCVWPGTYYSLVLGIMAIVKGSAILGAKAHLEKPPTGMAIMHMVNIVNGDVVNLVLGIIIMVYCNDEEAQEYFAKK